MHPPPFQYPERSSHSLPSMSSKNLASLADDSEVDFAESHAFDKDLG